MPRAPVTALPQPPIYRLDPQTGMNMPFLYIRTGRGSGAKRDGQGTRAHPGRHPIASIRRDPHLEGSFPW